MRRNSNFVSMETNQINSKIKRPEKIHEYWEFVRWSCLPKSWKGSKKKIKHLPDGIEELLECKTRVELAEKLKVAGRTLTEWSQMECYGHDVNDIMVSMIRNEFTPAVLMSFAKITAKEGDAARVKLFMEIFHGNKFIQTVHVQHSGTVAVANIDLSQLTDEQLDQLKAIKENLIVTTTDEP